MAEKRGGEGAKHAGMHETRTGTEQQTRRGDEFLKGHGLKGRVRYGPSGWPV